MTNKMTIVVNGREIELEKITVTPEVAATFLQSMESNRGLKRPKLAAMVTAMQNDDFPFCGDPIKFNDRGELEDGEHRLTAIVRSGKAQEMLVIWGMDPKARLYYDSGSNRNAGDQVKMNLGLNQAAAMAAAANLLIRWQSAKLLGRHVPPATPVVYRYVEEYADELTAAVRCQQAVRQNCTVSSAAVAAVFVRAHRISATDASQFFHQLAQGTDLKPGQPVTVLRNAIISRWSKERWTQLDQVYALTRMWNAERGGERLAKVQFPVEWAPSHFLIR